jgi:plasmid maintenance system killer protein
MIDEAWNINNPRPFPKATYHRLQWEEKDFYSVKINNEWVLRKYRKTDSKLKRKIRTKYWEKRNG